MYLALNNLQWLICLKTQPNRTIKQSNCMNMVGLTCLHIYLSICIYVCIYTCTCEIIISFNSFFFSPSKLLKLSSLKKIKKKTLIATLFLADWEAIFYEGKHWKIILKITNMKFLFSIPQSWGGEGGSFFLYFSYYSPFFFIFTHSNTHTLSSRSSVYHFIFNMTPPQPTHFLKFFASKISIYPDCHKIYTQTN